MEKKNNLLLDIDEVFCFPGFLDAINEFLGSNYLIDDFSDYYMDEAVIPKEVLRELNSIYNIYPCSSCINPFNIIGSGRLFTDKYNYLINSMPFIKPEHFIFTNAKHLFKANV